MNQNKFNFSVSEFNKIFPYYILLNKDLIITEIGISLNKLINKSIINSNFLDVFEFNRPIFENLIPNNFKTTCNQLISFVHKYDLSLILRGQINEHENGFLFLGTPWFREIEDLVKKKLTIKDFAFFDSTIDLLHILKNQEINNQELKDLLYKVNNQKKILNKDKEELFKLSLVASANNGGVVFTDASGIIYWCNEAYEKLTGFSKDQMIGKNPFEIGRNKDTSTQELYKMLNSFNNKESFDVEILHNKADNQVFWARTKGQPLYDEKSNFIGYFSMVYDITNEKIKDEKLQILSLITQENTNGVIIFDKLGKIEWVNNSFTQMTGYKLEDVVNSSFKSFLLGEQIDNSIFENIEKSIKKAKPLNCEILYNNKYEEKYWIRIQGQVIKDKKNEILKYFAIVENINKEKNYYENLKSERSKYLNIISNMNLGLLEVDNDDVILYANPTFEKLSGFLNKELIGNKATQLFVDNNYKKEILNKYELREKGISDSYEVEIINKNGEKRYWMISGAPNYDLNGQLIGSIGVHLDITNQKLLEFQKQDLLLKLEKQNLQLNEYAQIVSHDLKSPLRSIHSIITWIKEDNIKEFSNETIQYLNLIEGKVEKMDHLIQGILTYSKVDSLDFENKNLDLNFVINNIINLIEIPTNITIKILKKLPKIYADEFRIQQLFQNIIVNSITYIDKPIGIIEIDFIENQDNYIFSIKDNGPGISIENQKKIFNVFQSFTKNEKSTGIGLSIVKRIIDNYKGEIWIESELNIYSTFFIKLKKN
jgi:PAS domain S-box-containing protein